MAGPTPPPSTPPPRRPLREQLMIEQDVQSALLYRTALHGAALAVYFTLIQFFSQAMARPDRGALDVLMQFLDEAIYWGPGLMLLGPLFAYDQLKISNRFAGPIFRLRREMNRLIKHQSESPLSFRDEDYWNDLGDPFNQIREELLALRLENQALHDELRDGSGASQAAPDEAHDSAAQLPSASVDDPVQEDLHDADTGSVKTPLDVDADSATDAEKELQPA
ncbi:MAG: hypothetical protein AAF989_05685 [Planctomycetota bacterium]